MTTAMSRRSASSYDTPRYVWRPGDYCFDGTGTYEPLPGGTAWALGYREDPLQLTRLVRQCYFDCLALGDQAAAWHTAKRLHEQLTGSIDKAAILRAIHPQPIGVVLTEQRHADWVIELDALGYVLEVVV